MVSREVKAAFYFLAAVPMKINGILYKLLRAPRTGTVKVHLGPGQKNYLEGWVNVDANFVTARIDVWADLKNPLPFRDNSVDVFYSHHVIEHLPDTFLQFHFNDMYRCLKPGGLVRIGGPNGDTAIKKFVEHDISWFYDWPDQRTSIGGRFANFIFCRGEHLTILTHSYLRELAEKAGFCDIETSNPSRTRYPQVINQEVLRLEEETTPNAPHTLIIEARKPARTNG